MAAPGAGGHVVQDPWADYERASGGASGSAGPVGPARNLPQLARGRDLEDNRAPGRIHYWHNRLLEEPSFRIAWERSSPFWGGVGPRVDVNDQWSAHDAMW